jgi:hypothetical protein
MALSLNAGLMSRVPRIEPPAKGRRAEVPRADSQRASLAQLLLVARLRARTRRDLAVDSLERAAHVIFVTCKNWFAASPASPPPDNNNHQDADAHRHD